MVFLDVARRRLQPEVMDQPGLDPVQHVQALRGLERINFWSGSTRLLWNPLRQLALALKTRRLTILDIASGGGDVSIELWRKARRAGFDWQLEGWDLSATAVEYARGRAERLGANVAFQVRDALADTGPASFDAVVSSLFLHHLDEAQALQLLQNMARMARYSVLINDLERTPLGLLLARIGTRLLSASPVVHVDGPRSVEGAFTVDEARRLAERAGLSGARVSRHWPCRYLLSWGRT
jgi:2-polyprenyl-3-methyl-5-hydroxy-6-metoxy-1,4-benzoquinol methylase